MNINQDFSNKTKYKYSFYSIIILLSIFWSNNIFSKTTYEFKNLRVLDTNHVFQKLWFLDNDVYAFYDSTKLFMKVGVDGVLNNIIIDSLNNKNKISSIQMNDFDEFLIQMSNNDIYSLRNEFKEKTKITHLFNENFKFNRIICDHGTNFYAFNNSKIYIYNSNTSETKLKTVPPNIEIIDMLADKSGKIWILTKDKIYWTNDFEIWNEAKVNGIDKYIPSSFIESSSGNIYFLIDKFGVFCKLAEEEEFNIESFNLPMNLPFYFYNITNGFIQVNVGRQSYIFNEKSKLWSDIENKRILRLHKGNKRNEFLQPVTKYSFPISQFWIYDSLIVHDNNNDNSWIKVNDIDSLGHYIYDIKSIKIDSESSVFYTLSKNNYYGKWDFETGHPIQIKHINYKNNNTEKDLIHRSVFFTNDWKFYFYLTIQEKLKGYKIELYDNKNDSLIREFTIDNSNDTVLKDTTIISFKLNPLAIYNPATKDFYISTRSRFQIKAAHWGYAYRDYGGFYKINLSNNNVSIIKMSNEYTKDFKISPNNKELFFSTQFRYFAVVFDWYGTITDKWDKRSSLLYYMNLETGDKKLLYDTSANAYSFIETDDTFSNVYTNFDSSIVKIDKNGNSSIIYTIGKYSFDNTSFFDDGKFVFFRDIILNIDHSLDDLGSYYFYNLEYKYIYKKIPISTLGEHVSDFNNKSKALIISLNDGRMYKFNHYCPIKNQN